MCGSCGFPAIPGHWTEAGAGDTAREKLRARLRRTQVLRSVLQGYGLTAHDGTLAPGILVSNLSGAHVIAADMTELWKAAEQLGGHSIDPLDSRFTGPISGTAIVEQVS